MVLCNSHTRSYVMSASFQAGVAWRNLNMFNKHHLPKRVLVRLDYSCFSFRIYKNRVKKSWSIMLLSFRSQKVCPRKPCCWWTPSCKLVYKPMNTTLVSLDPTVKPAISQRLAVFWGFPTCRNIQYVCLVVPPISFIISYIHITYNIYIYIITYPFCSTVYYCNNHGITYTIYIY